MKLLLRPPILEFRLFFQRLTVLIMLDIAFGGVTRKEILVTTDLGAACLG